jgi:SAM-dependent MidA family methyltransferase
MRLVLYEPGLGYYSAGSAKLGEAGDFVTGPELGDFLARAITLTMRDALAAITRPAILELGAGTGRLASQLLSLLPEYGVHDLDYRILEPSAELRRRQVETLAPFGDRVAWLDELSGGGFEGLIIANEVADALPVQRFVKKRRVARPLGVAHESGRLSWSIGAADETLSAAIGDLERRLGNPLPDGYESEFCGLLGPWVATLSESLIRGAILLVDYGLPRREYYRPERSTGTLICHYRHRAHDDPFLYPGLQDISAWVDFSALGDAGAARGLELSGFTTQGGFLVEALERCGPQALSSLSPAERGGLKTLILPGEMGERFKVMLLSKDIEPPRLPGRDLRSRL